jgi:group I intron endonuclease
MIIYKATNKKNNKIYIGQTINTLNYRKQQHFREAKCDKRQNTYFHNALIKYGFDNFIFEIIEEIYDIDILNDREIYWIKYYDSTNKNKGYNLDYGGNNGYKNNTTKEKMRLSTKKLWDDKDKEIKMRQGLVKATKKWQEICNENRIEWICPICGNTLHLAPYEFRDKKYCSLKCAGKSQKNIDVLNRNSKNTHLNNMKMKKAMKEDIVKWCLNNKDLVINCPYNKIEPTLKPLMKYLSIKDLRSIFICFSVKNKKELLNCLKSLLL